MLIAGWWLGVALHETGHVTAAAFRGFSVVTMFVGPVFVTRGRLGVRNSWLGGGALAAPKRWEGPERFRRDFFWFVVAGPATSLALGGVGVLLAHPRSMIWIWSVISLVLGATSLIPARYPSGLTSDGQKLWMLRRWQPADAPMSALLLMTNSIRPRDWDDDLVAVARAESDSQGSHAIDATLLLYHRAIDSGDIPGARDLLQRWIDYVCGTARWPRITVSREVGFEACLFEVAWRGDRVAAQAWLDRAPLLKRDPATLADAIAKFVRTARRTGYPMTWLCHRATLERLASSSSSS